MHTILRKTWLIVIWFLCNNLIDAATDKITASYSGVQNADGLVATPDGEYIIAGGLTAKPLQPGQDPNSPISMADLQQNKVVKTIKTGNIPNYIVISKNGLAGEGH